MIPGTLVRTDADILRDVLDELIWDPEVDASDIDVNIEDGIVTLSGSVESYRMKLAAERATMRVRGVVAVVNDLVVRADRARSDTEIAQDVSAALDAMGVVPRNLIAVVVEDGIVTLEGQVQWDYERKAALDAVRQIPGVREVICRIIVKQPDISPDDIKAAIERALIRSAELRAEQIRVSVENGEVILSGTVRCPSEKEAAEAAAWRAKGANRVRNLIRVEPD